MFRSPKFAITLIVALLTAVLLAACSSATTNTPPTIPATLPPLNATLTPVETGATSGDAAAQMARLALAQSLKLNESDVIIQNTEAVQWPNACLGVTLPDTMCALHVVDGYRVTLVVGEDTYVYHTNADGSEAVPAQALSWHREGGVAGYCDSLVIDVLGQATAYSCQGQPFTAIGTQQLKPETRQQISQWLADFQPFSLAQSDTPNDGVMVNLDFQGLGTADASTAEQQAMADLAAEIFNQLAVETTAVTATPAPSPEEAAANTVNQFLQAFANDPNGNSSFVYLSDDLRAEVESGNPLSSILGVDTTYQSFGVNPMQAENGTAVVEATLNEVSPITRDFMLSETDGQWLIDTIVSYGVPAMALPQDHLNTAQLITGFAQTLQTHDDIGLEALLAPNAQLPPDVPDVNTAVNEVDGISTTSLTLLSAAPDRQIYSGTFWALPNPDKPSSWDTGSNTRWFALEQTPTGWRISQVSETPIS